MWPPLTPTHPLPKQRHHMFLIFLINRIKSDPNSNTFIVTWRTEYFTFIFACFFALFFNRKLSDHSLNTWRRRGASLLWGHRRVCWLLKLTFCVSRHYSNFIVNKVSVWNGDGSWSETKHMKQVRNATVTGGMWRPLLVTANETMKPNVTKIQNHVTEIEASLLFFAESFQRSLPTPDLRSCLSDSSRHSLSFLLFLLNITFK